MPPIIDPCSRVVNLRGHSAHMRQAERIIRKSRYAHELYNLYMWTLGRRIAQWRARVINVGATAVSRWCPL